MAGRTLLPGALTLALATWLAAATGAAQTDAGFVSLRTHPAIQYESRRTADPVAAIKRRVDAGDLRLPVDAGSGGLRTMLDALGVSLTSQIAVFSKGSLQSSLIEPGNPRVLFFNDEVSVGWVRGGIIEIAAQDPEQGVVFYTVARTARGEPFIERRNSQCLQCHESILTTGVPGMRLTTDHRRPLEQRWGGWYVTGNLGSIRHFGNVDIQRLARSGPPADPFNWASLDGRLDLSGYPTPYSDVAALLVFEHQMRAMNLLTRIGWEARIAQHEPRADATASLREHARDVVDYLLFVGEAPLASPVRGTSGFAEAFGAKGPRDSKGRSLRQLDLTTRLMRYRCSYMMYTAQFDALPAIAKAAIYERLWAILSGAERSQDYRHLDAADRRAIVEILLDTKADLPRFFSAAAVG